MIDRKRRVLKLLLRLLITMVLLWVVIKKIDLAELRRTAVQVKIRYLILVMVLYAFSFWVRSFRFSLILRILNCSVKTLKIFFVSSITMLYGLALPGLVSTSIKWYILKEHTGKASNVLSCMAYNQISELIIKILIGLIAVILANPSTGDTLPFVCGGIALIILFFCILILNKVTGTWINRMFKDIFHPCPPSLRKNIHKILGQIEMFQTAGWGFHLKMVMISIFASLIGIFIFIYAAKAASINVPPVALAWQCSVIFVLSRLPISIANLGIREIALIEFLGIYGVAKPDAFLMSMVIFTGVLFIATIGIICQLAVIINKNDSTS